MKKLKKNGKVEDVEKIFITVALINVGQGTAFNVHLTEFEKGKYFSISDNDPKHKIEEKEAENNDKYIPIHEVHNFNRFPSDKSDVFLISKRALQKETIFFEFKIDKHQELYELEFNVKYEDLYNRLYKQKFNIKYGYDAGNTGVFQIFIHSKSHPPIYQDLKK